MGSRWRTVCALCVGLGDGGRMRGKIRTERRACLTILLRVQPGEMGGVCAFVRRLLAAAAAAVMLGGGWCGGGEEAGWGGRAGRSLCVFVCLVC